MVKLGSETICLRVVVPLEFWTFDVVVSMVFKRADHELIVFDLFFFYNNKEIYYYWRLLSDCAAVPHEKYIELRDVSMQSLPMQFNNFFITPYSTLYK